MPCINYRFVDTHRQCSDSKVTTRCFRKQAAFHCMNDYLGWITIGKHASGVVANSIKTRGDQGIEQYTLQGIAKISSES